MKMKGIRICCAVLIVSLILPGLILAQEISVASTSTPDLKTDRPGITNKDRPNIGKEEITNGQILYTVYEVHNPEALIATRKTINTDLAPEDRFLAHGEFLRSNPHILEQIAGGEMENGKLNLTYYKKPIVLFVVLTQRYKNGQLDAAMINIKRKTKSVTINWAGKKMKVELELYQGQPI